MVSEQRVHVSQLRDRDGRELNKAVVVNPRTKRHEQLTVHTIHDAAVTGDYAVKVLDAVRALDRRREESAKGRH